MQIECRSKELERILDDRGIRDLLKVLRCRGKLPWPFQVHTLVVACDHKVGGAHGPFTDAGELAVVRYILPVELQVVQRYTPGNGAVGAIIDAVSLIVFAYPTILAVVTRAAYTPHARSVEDRGQEVVKSLLIVQGRTLAQRQAASLVLGIGLVGCEEPARLKSSHHP